MICMVPEVEQAELLTPSCAEKALVAKAACNQRKTALAQVLTAQIKLIIINFD